MSYTKTTIVNGTTSANKTLFDHIQTQYDEAKIDIDKVEQKAVGSMIYAYKNLGGAL